VLTKIELEELVALIAERLDPQRIILFGSYAKGTPTAKSDVDLMVVKDTAVPSSRRADAVAGLLRRYLVPIDVLVYTPEEVAEYRRERSSFMYSVVKTGRTVFERDPHRSVG
jgi:uncharacterized protein